MQLDNGRLTSVCFDLIVVYYSLPSCLTTLNGKQPATLSLLCLRLCSWLHDSSFSHSGKPTDSVCVHVQACVCEVRDVCLPVCYFVIQIFRI